jgi:hypothetical protein
VRWALIPYWAKDRSSREFDYLFDGSSSAMEQEKNTWIFHATMPATISRKTEGLVRSARSIGS